MIRVGTGYDLHRLEVGRPLILGGITVPHDRGPLGHSDSDALCHAITDALLGAAALGNIGLLFPDTDPAYRDANSIVLLQEAHRRLQEAGYSIVNIDATIIAQRPKLAPFLPQMAARLAGALGLPHDAVSVKAKTNEHVGPEGREEAISVQAAALIQRD